MLTQMTISEAAAGDGLGSPNACPPLGYDLPQFISWLRGRQASARAFAQQITRGHCEYSFWQRAVEFVASTKPILTVQPGEIMTIISVYETDAERLAALEALARPRLAYEWMQAGGPRRAFNDVTQEDIAKAQAYYQTQYSRKERK